MAITSGQRVRGRDVGRITLWLLLGVVLIAAAGVGAYATGYLDRWLPEPDRQSALDVDPPEELVLPSPRAASAVLPDAAAAGLVPRAVAAAVTPVLKDRSMGSHVGVAVASLDGTGRTWSRGSGSFVPASTLKLFTSVAALESLGPDHRFNTTVVRKPAATGEDVSEDLVLVGGGDPLLAREAEGAEPAYPDAATLEDLLDQTVTRLQDDRVSRVRVGYDATLFLEPSVNERWEPAYIGEDITSPVSALWVDQGTSGDGSGERAGDPAEAAAQEFADGLRAAGVRVRGKPVAAAAPEDPETVAVVSSPTVGQTVQHVLETSDNQAAEVLLRHVALATDHPASFAGGADGVEAALRRLGVPWQGVRVYDGSGLSRSNRVTLPAMLAVLHAAADEANPDLRGAISDLPVAGFNGSLGARFTTPAAEPGLGLARAKTGTLSGVHGLAGITTDRSGTPIVYVGLTDRVPLAKTLEARAALDEIAAALTGCGCTR